jgi:ABC-2 type transport system permease protein
LCIRNKNEFGLMETLGQYLLKLIALAAQWMIWCAILPEGAVVDGMTRRGMLVYVTVSAALAPLLDVRTPASGWLHDGTMLGMFLRPSGVYVQLAAHTVGNWTIPLLFYGAPLLLIASLAGFAPIPASGWFWLSLILCVSQGFAVDFLFACLLIRLRNLEWCVHCLREALTALLTGSLIPFAALPWHLGDVLAYSPFGTLAGAPLSICTGLGEPLPLIAAQIGWNLLLWPLAVYWFAASRERMVSYGG